MRSFLLLGLSALCLLDRGHLARAGEPPRMKFNEVREVAPGVFFRYSAISPTDPSVFGGSNNVWIVFEDYVAVIDANFPKEAGDVLEAIKKTTDKPVRFVLDTHHHGDHAYGNAVFGKAGAQVIAQRNCARLLRVDGPKQFTEAARGPTGRKDVAASTLKQPDLVFDDRLVLEDGRQRVEFLFLGHAHTAGDAVAYLPKHKLLCTGDACVNGAFNFMGHSDSASWVRALERMQQLDVELVCPGHGPLAGRELLEKQKRYFVELRREVQKGLGAGQTAEEIAERIDLPWYKEWTSVKPAGDNVKHVYGELTGRVAPWDLSEEFGVLEGPSPTKESPGWKPPRRVVVPSGLMPERLAELKRIAPEVEFIPARSAEAAARVVGDADAVVGFCSPDIVRAGKGLRWIQATGADVDQDLSEELVRSAIVLTNTQRVNGPPVADRTFALLLALTRGGSGGGAPTAEEKAEAERPELRGKTLLVVGLGGVGTEVARRAHAFGMRVVAVDPKEAERPDFVFSLQKPEALLGLLPQADVVVLACPLTAQTRGLMGAEQFRAVKEGIYLINVGRAALVRAADLVEALDARRLAGVGLSVTDPRTPGEFEALRARGNVLFSNGGGPPSREASDRQWRLVRENVRRFMAGEPLLCVVDKAKGY
jgi:phosphoglycerate dehydrogenase-like enzyme/glyoxylase-like metal-dependent hydrolase (beta-lactamase superfamily II)